MSKKNNGWIEYTSKSKEHINGKLTFIHLNNGGVYVARLSNVFQLLWRFLIICDEPFFLNENVVTYYMELVLPKKPFKELENKIQKLNGTMSKNNRWIEINSETRKKIKQYQLLYIHIEDSPYVEGGVYVAHAISDDRILNDAGIFFYAYDLAKYFHESEISHYMQLILPPPPSVSLYHQ